MENLQFIILEPSGGLIKAWHQAFKEHLSKQTSPSFHVIQDRLAKIERPHDRFDCIVSPANSYGRLDGGFDMFISETLAPPDSDYMTVVSQVAQKKLYERWRGYAPPGTCTLIPLQGTPCEKNKHDCKFIALCPTMRIPQTIEWDREVVYNCIWSLLVAIDNHNLSVLRTNEPQIRSVLMTGLGTGVGNVSANRWAQQTALAFKHFIASKEEKNKWSNLGWSDAMELSGEVRKSHSL